MAVRGTIFELTLPSLFLSFFGVPSAPPPDEASKDGYEKAGSTPSTSALRLFSFASFFSQRVPEIPSASIGERVKHVYQERLKPPFNRCRHAVLKMIADYLRRELKITRRDVRKIIPCEIYNGEVDAVVSGWRRGEGFEGPVRRPTQDNLQRVLGTIDAHLDAGLPVPVYVSHTNGLHVVLVTDKTITEDGRIAYHFIDPATRDTGKSRGTLVWTDEIQIERRGRTRTVRVENFVRRGNTGKKVRGTANQQYYLLGVYSYIDRFTAARVLISQLQD